MKHLGDVAKIQSVDIENYTVYQYTFPDGMIYIGRTKHSVAKRKTLGYKHNSRITEAIAKCGWDNIRIDVLAEHLSKADADNMEIEMISAMNSTNPQIGYNTSYGGSKTFAGLRHTEQHKKRMSELLKGRKFSEETIEKMRIGHVGKHCGANNPMYGKPKSKETIQKQYLAHKAEMKPVIQMDLQGNIIAKYDSLHQAANASGLSRATITNSATGKIKAPKKYIWAYVLEDSAYETSR